MNEITTSREEQFVLFTIECDRANKPILERLRNLVVAGLEAGDFNFVVDCDKVKYFEPSLYVKIDEINHIIQKENGVLVVACLHQGNDLLMKDLDIVATPTLSEASDYIFMEEIEKHFLSDEADEPDESELS